MISDQLVSVTDLRQSAARLLNELDEGEKIIVVHNKPKAALIAIESYEQYKVWTMNKDLIDSMLSLAYNPSFEFLHDEPDLYESV
jgi:prevent-host-death family protein